MDQRIVKNTDLLVRHLLDDAGAELPYLWFMEILMTTDWLARTETMEEKRAIPSRIAWQLCAEIRKEYGGKWWTFAGMQCAGCTRFSKGDPAKMCVASRPDYRGCNLVSKAYDGDGKRTERAQ